jgi:predicted porin
VGDVTLPDGTCPATAPDFPVWKTWLENVSNSFGIGVKGKVTGKLDVSTNVGYSKVVDHYPMAGIDPAGAPTGFVPNINTQIFDLKLTAKYALQKNMGFRFNYIYNHFKTNDWTWSHFVYSDGTQVIQNPNQVVNFFGLTYYLTWQ